MHAQPHHERTPRATAEEQHRLSAASLPIALTEAQGPTPASAARRQLKEEGQLQETAPQPSTVLSGLCWSPLTLDQKSKLPPQAPRPPGLALSTDASLRFSRDHGSASREGRTNLEISVGAGVGTAAVTPAGRGAEPGEGGASPQRGRGVSGGGGESDRGGAAGRDLLNAGIARWRGSLWTEATAHARPRRRAGSRAPVTSRPRACGGCVCCDGDVSGPGAGWC